jgi:hypothetical protein
MSVEPFKYLIQAVAVERDDETGRIVKEHPAQVVTVFTAEDAARAVQEFEKTLAEMQSQNGDRPESIEKER